MNAPVFTAREVLQFAVKNEQYGEALYRKIAKRTPEAAVRKLFLFLAREEARHARTFTRMLAGTRGSVTRKAGLDEYTGYMIAYYMADILFAENRAEELPPAPGPAAALDFGIRQELDSIHYYEQAQALVPAGQAKQIDRIIAEEHSHFIKFSKLKEKYLAKRRRG